MINALSLHCRRLSRAAVHEDPEKGHVHCQHFNSNKKLTRLSRHAPCSVCLVYLSVALNPKTLNPKQMSCNLVTKDHRVRMPHILAMRKSYIYIIKRILKILIITYIINEKIKTVIFEVWTCLQACTVLRRIAVRLMLLTVFHPRDNGVDRLSFLYTQSFLVVAFLQLVFRQ